MANRDILIVDDDESIQNLFEIAAKKFNINIFTAQNGTEALSKCEKQDYKLVITDLHMPKMNGIDFIKRVREMPQYKNFPIIIITANLKDFDSQIAFLDKVHVIEKPIKIKTIKSIFGNMFGEAGPVKTLKIEPQAILDKLTESFSEKTTTLVEIITKEKPLFEVIGERITVVQMTDHFFISYPIEFWGEHFNIVFSFDLNMATLITDKFHSNDISLPIKHDRTYAITLQKVCDLLVKKSLEILEHDLKQIHIRLATSVGNHTVKNNYVFPIHLDHRSIIVKNSAGEMKVHIIHEN